MAPPVMAAPFFARDAELPQHAAAFAYSAKFKAVSARRA